jgi:hypothetical protein
MTIMSAARVFEVELLALLEPRGQEGSTHEHALAETIHTLALRVHGEYSEMPGLRLTVPQAARLFGVAPDVAHAVLDELRRASVLSCSDRGIYSLSR